MSTVHERFVATRFDTLAGRFNSLLTEGDARYRAIERALGNARGLRVLDLGCGKGRFARRLAAEGASVIGLDLSREMLAEGSGLTRVRASALRLPFASRWFDAAIAVEVFQHLPAPGVSIALRELGRVLRPGGAVAIIDKNALALNARRPWLPNLLVKWIDERRDRWMYRASDPVRERWFVPRALRGRMFEHFVDVRVEFVCGRDEVASPLFRRLPWIRSMVCWRGRVPGGQHE